jgi:DNA-directed RNA polymerase specialized sigma24 family protein
MPEAVNQYDLLIRYLLGVVSDAERRAVEEQFFASDADLNVLLQAEDELIDDYVRGTLSTSDRRLFESNFLCTHLRRQRLEMVQSFVQVLAQTDFEGSVSPEGFSRSLPIQQQGGSSRPATSHNQLSLASFSDLLRWLDSDYEKAAEKYETIRNLLIKVFASRGFDNPEDLADDTVDRVASRAAELIEKYVGDPVTYFYGVARAVMLGALRHPAHDLIPAAIAGDESVSDQAYGCLEKCLEQLSDTNRDLILQYYAFEKENKLDNRKELAQSLGISPNALRLRVHRIRQGLENCVRSCLKGENQVDVNQYH